MRYFKKYGVCYGQATSVPVPGVLPQRQYVIPDSGYSGTRSLRLLLGIQPLLEDDADENGDDDDGKDGDHEHHEEDIICHVGEACKDHHKGGGAVAEAGPESKVLPCVRFESPDQVRDNQERAA